jgi:hypothetical protein
MSVDGLRPLLQLSGPQLNRRVEKLAQKAVNVRRPLPGRERSQAGKIVDCERNGVDLATKRIQFTSFSVRGAERATLILSWEEWGESIWNIEEVARVPQGLAGFETWDLLPNFGTLKK